MAYKVSTIMTMLDQSNNALADLKALQKQLDSIIDALHDGNVKKLQEAFEHDVKYNWDYRAQVYLKKRRKKLAQDIKQSVKDNNDRLKKTNVHFPKWCQWMSLNTFELEKKPEGRGETVFDEKVAAFISAISEKSHYFSDDSPLFDNKNAQKEFRVQNSILLVKATIDKKIDTVSHFMKEIKRLYNQDRLELDRKTGEDAEKNTYLVELKSVKQEGQDLSEWVFMLRDNETLRQRYAQLKKGKSEKDANEAIRVEILKSYVASRDAEYFDRVFKNNEELVESLKSLCQKDQNEAWSDSELHLIEKAIRVEMDNKRSLYIRIKLDDAKDKTKGLMVSQLTTVFSLLATTGEACLSAYAMASALAMLTDPSFKDFTGGLLTYLGNHPAVAIGTVSIFLAVLLVNTMLFQSLMKKLLGMFAKNRLMKNQDGSLNKKRGWLIPSFGISVITAVGLGALSFNGCQAAFSAVLQASANSPTVLAISAVIASVSFLAMVSFNYEFFLGMFANWGSFKKSMDRLFLKGRCKTGKYLLLGVCFVLAALYTVGSLMVNFASVGTMLNGFQVNQLASVIANSALTGISGFFYAVAGFGANKELLASLRLLPSKMKTFLCNPNKKEMWGHIAAAGVKFVASIVFFVSAIALVVARMAIASVKLALSIMGMMSSLLFGWVTASVYAAKGRGFGRGFKAHLTFVQSVSNQVTKRTVWWNRAFMYCAKRGGPLGSVLNAMSQASLRQIDMKSMTPVVVAPTMADSFLLSDGPNRSALMGIASQEAAEAGTKSRVDQAHKGEQEVSSQTASDEAEKVVGDQVARADRRAVRQRGFWGSMGSSLGGFFDARKDNDFASNRDMIDAIVAKSCGNQGA